MNTFANKVAAERAVLRIVNRHTPGGRQLAGLSWAAIEIWQQIVGLAASDPLVTELKVLSDLCQRLSDRSHETFEKLDPMLAQKIDLRINSLEHLVIGRTAQGRQSEAT
jgi:hypothetical protein